MIPYCGIGAKQGNMGDFTRSWWQIQETPLRDEPWLHCFDFVCEDGRLLPLQLTAGPGGKHLNPRDFGWENLCFSTGEETLCLQPVCAFVPHGLYCCSACLCFIMCLPASELETRAFVLRPTKEGKRLVGNHPHSCWG